MSTGAECWFEEREPRKWFYKIQDYPYGHTDSYREFGPFGTFKEAHAHLDRHHTNPGGYSIHTEFPCEHDLITVHNVEWAPWCAKSCDRCGESFPAEGYNEWQQERNRKETTLGFAEWKAHKAQGPAEPMTFAQLMKELRKVKDKEASVVCQFGTDAKPFGITHIKQNEDGTVVLQFNN